MFPTRCGRRKTPPVHPILPTKLGTVVGCAAIDDDAVAVAGGVREIPCIEPGEEVDSRWSSNWLLSGNGAEVPAECPAWPPLGKTPWCEKGYRGIPNSRGCSCVVIRTISVMSPCKSFSWRAANGGCQTVHRVLSCANSLPIGDRLPYVSMANLSWVRSAPHRRS